MPVGFISCPKSISAGWCPKVNDGGGSTFNIRRDVLLILCSRKSRHIYPRCEKKLLRIKSQCSYTYYLPITIMIHSSSAVFGAHAYPGNYDQCARRRGGGFKTRTEFGKNEKIILVRFCFVSELISGTRRRPKVLNENDDSARGSTLKCMRYI